MRRVQGDGVAIAVAHWPGQGRPVVCLHGLTANCRAWDVMAAELAPDCDVWALDLRGRGRSDKPAAGYGIAQHCADILAMIAGLGLERPALMGHSLGAYIALELAAGHPELIDRVVLVDGGARLNDEELAKVFVWVAMSVGRVGVVMPSFAEYRAMVQMAPFLQPWNPVLDDYLAYEIEEVPGGVRSSTRKEALQQDAESLREVHPEELFGKVACPVLILRATQAIFGGDDLILPQRAAAEMQEQIADATLKDLAGANHYNIINADLPARGQALREFLVR